MSSAYIHTMVMNVLINLAVLIRLLMFDSFQHHRLACQALLSMEFSRQE